MKALRHLGAADRRLGALIERVGPFRLRVDRMQSPFASLAESIVYQQLSGKAAETIYGRVEAALGEVTPEAVLRSRVSDLRGCGLSGSKTAAVKDLAAKALQGVVPSIGELESMDDEAIVERLTQVRGIGRWTVEMLLIFRLGRPDVLPATDYGVRKGFAKTFRRALPTPADVLRRGERWRPYRSVAAWYLWRALEL